MKRKEMVELNEDGYEYDKKTGIITILKSGTYEFANGKLVRLEKGQRVNEEGSLREEEKERE